ncbi:MAG TPA: choice-of-anchor W domain-containing protein [Leptolyngbyaceae cyanobacterium]
MKRLRQTLFALATLGLGIFSVSSAANAFTLVDRTGFTDDEFNNLIKTGEYAELFVAQSRIGNNSNNGDYELSINNPIVPDPTNPNKLIGGLPVNSPLQHTWGNGNLVDFILEYTGSVVNYTVGGKLLSTNVFSGPVTDIFLRTRAGTKSNSTKSRMELSNLVFNGVGIGSLSSSVVGSNSSDIDYLQIAGISSPFTLTGKSLMSWEGIAPNGSNIAYQIKVGTTPQTEVPEPATVAAILLTGGVLALGKKKEQKAN